MLVCSILEFSFSELNVNSLTPPPFFKNYNIVPSLHLHQNKWFALNVKVLDESLKRKNLLRYHITL